MRSFGRTKIKKISDLIPMLTEKKQIHRIDSFYEKKSFRRKIKKNKQTISL